MNTSPASADRTSVFVYVSVSVDKDHKRCKRCKDCRHSIAVVGGFHVELNSVEK